MIFDELEKIKFSDLFDGVYLGGLLTGFELIICLVAYLIQFLLFGTYSLESIYVVMLFLTNISFFIVLKHNKLFRFSVWAEINKSSKKRIKCEGETQHK